MGPNDHFLFPVSCASVMQGVVKGGHCVMHAIAPSRNYREYVVPIPSDEIQHEQDLRSRGDKEELATTLTAPRFEVVEHVSHTHSRENKRKAPVDGSQTLLRAPHQKRTVSAAPAAAGRGRESAREEAAATAVAATVASAATPASATSTLATSVSTTSASAPAASAPAAPATAAPATAASVSAPRCLVAEVTRRSTTTTSKYAKPAGGWPGVLSLPTCSDAVSCDVEVVWHF
jgi:hypothetical protein